MKRVFLAGLTIFLLEVSLVVVGFHFFYRDVPFKITKTNTQELCIDTISSLDVIIRFTTRCPVCDDWHTHHKIYLTKEEYEEFKETNIIGVPFWNLHALIWVILWWVFAVFFTIAIIIRFIELLEGCWKSHCSCKKCRDCLGESRCLFYKNLVSMDLEPNKQKWYKFWGY